MTKFFDDILTYYTFLLFQFIGIICMSLSSPAFRGASHFFLFVVICSFIATVLWSFVYFLGIRDVLNLPINWLLSVSYFLKI